MRMKTNELNIHIPTLKVIFDIFLLFCLSLKESAFGTRKNSFCFTSKATFDILISEF